MSTIEILQTILESQCGIPAEKLRPDSTLRDLEIDSLNALVLAFEIETKLGVQIIGKANFEGTLKDMAESIDLLVKSKVSTNI